VKVTGEIFQVGYDPGTATITFEGTLWLRGTDEYAPDLVVVTTMVQVDLFA
jgi:hypothetical protein